MTRSLFDKILWEIKRHSVDAVVPFFRGEPLLHPEFGAIMDALKTGTDFKVQLATNAMLMTHELSRKLLDLKLDFITFSLDAMTHQAYESIRQGGCFETVMDNVRQFLNLRAAMPGAVTEVQVSATETNENIHELEDFLAYWEPRVDRVRIYPRHSENGKFGKLGSSADKKGELVREACGKLFREMVIYFNGDVGVCNHDWNRTERIGTVSTHSIEQVWQSDAYNHIRKLHMAGKWNRVAPCNTCDHWQPFGLSRNIVGYASNLKGDSNL